MTVLPNLQLRLFVDDPFVAGAYCDRCQVWHPLTAYRQPHGLVCADCRRSVAYRRFLARQTPAVRAAREGW
jgi:hypothetical protein